MTTPLTVQLAEAFGSKPSFKGKSVLALIDELVELNLDGQQSGSFDEQLRLAQKAEDVHVEIERRLSLVDGFHGTEATRIRSILDTGLDEPWWQK